MSRERPILFSGSMVRAILAGQKIVTRRVVGLPELQPSTTPGYDWTWRGQAPVKSVAQQRRHPRGCWQDVRAKTLLGLCPYGIPGDRLWVRETWWRCPCDQIVYREKFDAGGYPNLPAAPSAWRPSIFMERKDSRITLEVVSVRVERLHAITEEDAIREGVDAVSVADVPRNGTLSRRDDFAQLWQKINGKRAPWGSNPFVWRIEFRRVEVHRG